MVEFEYASQITTKGTEGTSVGPIFISSLSPEDERQIVDLIRQNLDSFEEAGSVLAASFRRLESFYSCYSSPKNIYLVAKAEHHPHPLGGVGIGPLAGLPPSEGIGEIRELVIDKKHRKQGIGSALLQEAIQWAKNQKYTTLYLETTDQMKPAMRLFRHYGFSPVIDKTKEKEGTNPNFPCYFRLDQL